MSSLPVPATVNVEKSQRGGIVRGLKVRWTRFKQNRNTGSSHSMFDRDFPLGGGSTEASTSATGVPDELQRKRDVYYAIPLHKGGRSKDGDESIGRHNNNSRRKKLQRQQGKASEIQETEEDDFADVDEVVVDNSFEVGGHMESLTEPSGAAPVTENQPNVAMQPGQGKFKGVAFGWNPKDKENALNLSSSHTHSAHDTGSMAHTGFTSLHLQFVVRGARYLHGLFKGVFLPRFDDEQHEKQFTSQEWYLGRMLALIASGFLVVNWVLGCIFVARPFVLFDTIFYFAIAPVLTVPLPLVIILRWPVRYPMLYQIYLTMSLWCWTYWFLLTMILCGFYSHHSVFTCGNKDFLGLFYFATGFPMIGLFAMGQRRLPAAIMAIATVVVIGACILPYRHAWGRLLANIIIFYTFIIYIHWSREMADRDRFIMSRQIKDAYLYRHRLQMREKQIQTSKQRLTGYIFHEVRVPLNTAMLAVQNIEASGTISKPLELEFSALSGSLTVMSKVLNDVLDLNRMDAGKFESVNKPYAFHKVIESLLIPLRLAASAKGLQLIQDLDPRIDEFVLESLIAAKKAKGDYEEGDEIEPLVVGDEMRCRQIFTNLTSNATKFSPPGGKIEVVTRLLWPNPPGVGSIPPVGPGDPEWFGNTKYENSNGQAQPTESVDKGDTPHSMPELVSTASSGRIPIFGSVKDKDRGKQKASPNEKDEEERFNEKTPITVPVDQIVIRIEVRDTGTGIKKRDVRDARLFSPYVQTEIGRYQGGKGTGLGLALVRRIVKLSGGRLGVKSKFQQGSTFWVELPLGVGNRAVHAQSTDGGSRDVSIRSRSVQPTKHRDFAMNGSPEEDSARASFTYLPPAPHFSHRTIMEQHGRVEMTPSRPEYRHQQEMTYSSTEDSMTANPQSFMSDSNLTAPPRAPEAARLDTSNSAPAALDAPQIAETDFGGGQNPKTAQRPAAPLSVLVVDDDPLTRKLMTRLLTRLGCAVTTAENGEMALEILLGPMFTPSESATPSTLMPPTPGTSDSGLVNMTSQAHFFDVIFLDNQMPKMSGLEAIARLRASGREDLAVGVTGNAMIRDQDEYLNAGVDHVLIKPVLEKSLRQMLSLAGRRRDTRDS